ncbi:MAG: lysostaphin resistance A-like protein [Actinomycetota bacterium]
MESSTRPSDTKQRGDVPDELTPVEQSGPREQLRPQVAWTGLDLVFISLGGLVFAVLLLALLGVLVGLVGPLNVNLGVTIFVVILALLIYGCVCFCAWLFVLKRRRVGLKDTGFQSVPLSVMFEMIPLGIGVLVLNGLVIAASRLLFTDVPTAAEQVVAGELPSSGEFAALTLLVVGVAPLVEEFLFRGLLMRYFLSKMRASWAIVATALFFAMFHAVVVLIPTLFVLGLFLGWVAYRHNSIYPAIALHAVNNAVAMVAVAGAL